MWKHDNIILVKSLILFFTLKNKNAIPSFLYVFVFKNDESLLFLLS